MQPSQTPTEYPLSPEQPKRNPPSAPPITEPKSEPEAKAKGVLIPKELLDHAYREARKHYAVVPDMTFAFAMASHAIRDNWEHKDGKFIRKEKPFANYIPPKDDEHRPPAYPNAAEARARWNEAKREGDPDRMTRTANDLLRATEAEQPPEPAQGNRHPASLILAPEPEPADEAAAHHEAQGPDIAERASNKLPLHEEAQAVSENPEFQPAVFTPEDDTNKLPGGSGQPVAWVTDQGALTGATVARPNERSWTPVQRANASAIESSLAPVGAAIQRHGTPEQKAAWRRISRFSLQPTSVRTGGASDYADGVFSVDLNQVGARVDPKDPRRVLPPDRNYVNFMIVHEVFHATESNQNAMREAYERQGRRWHKGTPPIGSAQWSVEVRHDKMVYDFLVKAGLLPDPPPPIQRIAPYYAEHLQHPEIPVHTFKIPGYDRPIDAPQGGAAPHSRPDRRML